MPKIYKNINEKRIIISQKPEDMSKILSEKIINGKPYKLKGMILDRSKALEQAKKIRQTKLTFLIPCYDKVDNGYALYIIDTFKTETQDNPELQYLQSEILEMLDEALGGLDNCEVLHFLSTKWSKSWKYGKDIQQLKLAYKKAHEAKIIVKQLIKRTKDKKILKL